MSNMIPQLQARRMRFLSLLFTGYGQRPYQFDIRALQDIGDGVDVIPIGANNDAVGDMVQFSCK
jgi:hypothetical protein